MKICILRDIRQTAEDNTALQFIGTAIQLWQEIELYSKIDLDDNTDNLNLNKTVREYDYCILFLSKHISNEIRERRTNNSSIVLNLLTSLRHSNLIAIKTQEYSVNDFLDNPPTSIKNIPANKTAYIHSYAEVSLNDCIDRLRNIIYPQDGPTQHFKITFLNTFGQVEVTKDFKKSVIGNRYSDENPYYEIDLHAGIWALLFEDVITKEKIEKKYTYGGETPAEQQERIVTFSRDIAISRAKRKYEKGLEKYKEAVLTKGDILENEIEETTQEDILFPYTVEYLESRKIQLKQIIEQLKDCVPLFKEAYANGHRLGEKEAKYFLDKIPNDIDDIYKEITEIEKSIRISEGEEKKKNEENAPNIKYDTDRPDTIDSFFEIDDVTTKYCTYNGKNASKLLGELCYICPTIYYKTNSFGFHSVNIKIYTPGNTLIAGNDNSVYTYSDAIPIPSNTTNGVFTLKKFGDKSIWLKAGVGNYRMEFYDNEDTLLYKLSFELHKSKTKYDQKEPTKVCPKCNKVKPESKFKRGKDICNSCFRRKILKIWYLCIKLFLWNTAVKVL